MNRIDILYEQKEKLELLLEEIEDQIAKLEGDYE